MDYTSKSLPHRLLVGLNNLRNKGMYCDVSIIAGSSCFKYLAHRVVLASVSDVFVTMLNEDFTDSQQKEIVVGGVEEREMQLIINFIYTSQLTIDKDNVQSLLQASTYLCIVELKEICSDFLKQRLDYTSETLAHQLLVGFNNLRNKQIYCDVIIVVGSSQVIHLAHRVVLASVSDFFAAMLGGNFTESQQKEIVIGGVEERALKLIIDFIYTSKITIDEDNVQSLLQASTYLQIIEVKEICVKFLEERLNLSNILTMKTLAEENGCSELALAAESMFQLNVEKVLQSEDFKLLGKDQLMQIISSDDLNVQSEVTVYEAIMKWKSHDGGERTRRKNVLPYLLQHVRQHLIPKDYFSRIAADKRHLMLNCVYRFSNKEIFEG